MTGNCVIPAQAGIQRLRHRFKIPAQGRDDG